MQFLLSSIKHNECYLCVKASLISVFHFFPWTDRFSTATQNSFYWEYIGSRKELYYKMNMGLSLQDMVICTGICNVIAHLPMNTCIDLLIQSIVIQKL